MRLTWFEIALADGLALLLLACWATRRRARQARGVAAYRHARATVTPGPDYAEAAILAGLRDRPYDLYYCGCTRFKAGQPEWLRCDEHSAKAVDDEIAGWRI